MKWMVVLLLASTARADDSARQLAEGHLRVARDAARGGHCDVVLDLGPKIEALHSPTNVTFRADAAVAACYGAPVPVDVPPTVIDRPVIAPPQKPRVVMRDRGTPPLDGGRLGGELLLGGAAGIGGATLGVVAAVGLSNCEGDGEFACFGQAIIGGSVGLVFGTSVGVYTVGAAGEQTGSFAATLGGSVLGGLAGIAAQSLQGIVIGSIAGAMLGFNASRAYEVRAVPAVMPARDGAAYVQIVGGTF